MTFRKTVDAFLVRRTSRLYARRLWLCLRADYGAGEFYTVAQVRRAMAKVGVPASHVALGYAAFLPGDVFHGIDGVADDYQALRDAMMPYLAGKPGSSFEPAPENAYAYPTDTNMGHHG